MLPSIQPKAGAAGLSIPRRGGRGLSVDVPGKAQFLFVVCSALVIAIVFNYLAATLDQTAKTRDRDWAISPNWARDRPTGVLRWVVPSAVRTFLARSFGNPKSGNRELGYGRVDAIRMGSVSKSRKKHEPDDNWRRRL